MNAHNSTQTISNVKLKYMLAHTFFGKSILWLGFNGFVYPLFPHRFMRRSDPMTSLTKRQRALNM